jgi:hypothetical protein
VKTQSMELAYLLLEEADRVICRLCDADAGFVYSSSVRQLNRICEALQLSGLQVFLNTVPRPKSAQEVSRWTIALSKSFECSKDALLCVLDAVMDTGSKEGSRQASFDTERSHSSQAYDMRPELKRPMAGFFA